METLIAQEVDRNRVPDRPVAGAINPSVFRLWVAVLLQKTADELD